MIAYKAIGVIRTPFKQIIGTPIQPQAAKGTRGTVEIFKEYEKGLDGIEDFSHIILIYHMHMVMKTELKVKPYMGDLTIGVFATRAPPRPNPIGISVVKLVERSDNILLVENVDMLDGTPLLDIKPYVPEFDGYMKNPSVGWLKDNIYKLKDAKDDGRFIP